jgi:hypothetical protein
MPSAMPPRPFGSAMSPRAALPLPSARPLATATATAAASASVAQPSVAPTIDPVLARPFTDEFDRVDLGPDWNATSPLWRISGGRMCVENAHNHPLWLRRRLPVNARIEFDATSSSPDGDLKAEFWGDGKSAAQTVSYNSATSYITIYGGWKNQFDVLARIDEHAPDRPELRIDDQSDDLRARRVEPNHPYHFKVVREDGKTVRWYVDDLEILSYPDPKPLAGPGHDHFGFNDWEVHVCFDHLSVSPAVP